MNEFDYEPIRTRPLHKGWFIGYILGQLFLATVMTGCLVFVVMRVGILEQKVETTLDHVDAEVDVIVNDWNTMTKATSSTFIAVEDTFTNIDAMIANIDPLMMKTLGDIDNFTLTGTELFEKLKKYIK